MLFSFFGVCASRGSTTVFLAKAHAMLSLFSMKAQHVLSQKHKCASYRSIDCIFYFFGGSTSTLFSFGKHGRSRRELCFPWKKCCASPSYAFSFSFLGSTTVLLVEAHVVFFAEKCCFPEKKELAPKPRENQAKTKRPKTPKNNN